MTSSQEAVPQRQDAHGAAKIALVAAAAVAGLGCLWLIAHILADGGNAREVTVATTVSFGLAAGVSYATWRYAVRRTQAALDRAVAGNHEQADQIRLLRAVIDGQPDAVLVVDGEDRCVLANRALARRVSSQPDEVVDAPMADFLNPRDSAVYEDLNRRARELATPQSRVHRSGRAKDLRVIRSEHIPIAEPPGVPGGVMIVDRDLTGIAAAHENDSRMMNQLVRTLVKLLDGRDPFAAHHSAKVAIVAHAVAQELGLGEELTSTAKLAGSLLNVGKILAPADLLTRDGALSDDERQRVRNGIQASADLIDHIDFPGPVVDTLRQVFEKWDGSGVPRGLKGDEILITAQAVSLANSFVAMISPRAYRAAASIDAAIADLKREAGTTYGPDIVAALANRLRDRTTLEDLE